MIGPSHLPMLLITLRAINTAEVCGWAGQTEARFGVQAAAVWRNGLMWNALTLILLLLLTLTGYFSYEERTRRVQKKQQAENLPAPSILAENPQRKTENPHSGSL